MGKIIFKVNTLTEYTAMLYGFLSPYDQDDVPKEIVKVIQKTESLLTPLLKSDLSYFNGKLHLYNIPKHFSTYLGIESVEVFINQLEKLKTNEFWKILMVAIFSLPEDAPMSDVEEMINNDDYLSLIDYSFEAITEFKSQLEDLLPRLILFYKQFYKKIFKPVEDELLEIANKHKDKLSLEYKTSPEEFIKCYIKVNGDEFQKNEDFKAEIHVGVCNYDNITFTVSNDKPEEMFVMFGFLVADYLKEEVSEELIKSVGEATKLSMIKMLASKSMYSSELAEALSLNRATISHHIYQLTKLGVIKIDYAKGKKVYYGLNIEKIQDGFDRFIQMLERKGETNE